MMSFWIRPRAAWEWGDLETVWNNIIVLCILERKVGTSFTNRPLKKILHVRLDRYLKTLLWARIGLCRCLSTIKDRDKNLPRVWTCAHYNCCKAKSWKKVSGLNLQEGRKIEVQSKPLKSGWTASRRFMMKLPISRVYEIEMKVESIGTPFVYTVIRYSGLWVVVEIGGGSFGGCCSGNPSVFSHWLFLDWHQTEHWISATPPILSPFRFFRSPIQGTNSKETHLRRQKQELFGLIWTTSLPAFDFLNDAPHTCRSWTCLFLLSQIMARAVP